MISIGLDQGQIIKGLPGLHQLKNNYKRNSTYTYGVISQNVQLLHQVINRNLLKNKRLGITCFFPFPLFLTVCSCIYSSFTIGLKNVPQIMTREETKTSFQLKKTFR